MCFDELLVSNSLLSLVICPSLLRRLFFLMSRPGLDGRGNFAAVELVETNHASDTLDADDDNSADQVSLICARWSG